MGMKQIQLATLSLVCIMLTVACTALPFATESAPTATAEVVPTAEATAILAGGAGGALTEDSDLVVEEGSDTGEVAPDATATVALPIPSIILPTIDPLDVDRNVTIGGSATVYPITRRMYRRFVREGYAGVMKIERVGTGEGFRLLCSIGTADIVNAGQAASPSQVELCSSISRVPVPFMVGQAAVSLLVSPENDFVSSVTLAQVSEIFTATLWSDVDPQWPSEPIQHFLPRADSDEFAAFVRLVMAGDGDALRTAPNTTLFDTESELIQAFTDNPYAIGFGSHLLLLQGNDEFLRAVPIDDSLPTARTMQSGSYPLSFPLYLYTDPGILRTKPQVVAFLNFYLNHVNEEIREVGFFAAPAAEMDAARTQLLEILGEE